MNDLVSDPDFYNIYLPTIWQDEIGDEPLTEISITVSAEVESPDLEVERLWELVKNSPYSIMLFSLDTVNAGRL